MEQVERRERQRHALIAQPAAGDGEHRERPERQRQALEQEQGERMVEDRVDRRDHEQDERDVIAQPVHAPDRAEQRPVQHPCGGLDEDRQVEIDVQVVAELERQKNP